MIQIPIPNGRLREMREKDLSTIEEMSKRPDVLKYYMQKESDPFLDETMEKYWRFMLQEEAEMRYAAKNGFIRQAYYLVIERHKSLNGMLSMHVSPYKYSPCQHVVEIGYFVDEEFRRKGIAESCVKAAIPYTFNSLDSGLTVATCLPENVPSIRLLEKVGMKKIFEGISQKPKSFGKTIVSYGISVREFDPTLELKLQEVNSSYI